MSHTDCRALYLTLLKRSLIGLTYGDPPLARPRLRDSAPPPSATFDLGERESGRDWPASALSMIGLKRMDNLQWCIESVLARDVPGDLMETGVWRGGATIFMRGILKAHGNQDRRVWVADSFAGLPAPDLARYPQDELLEGLNRIDSVRDYLRKLAVPLEEVKRNFERHGLLDESVKFLPGWFKETLPIAPIEELAVLRLDGDLYESTHDAFTWLYPKLSAGGFVIIDDFDIPSCRAAVEDYRAAHRISDPIQDIDRAGAFWLKSAA